MKFLASYSYSLYLIHNTVLILVLEHVTMRAHLAEGGHRRGRKPMAALLCI